MPVLNLRDVEEPLVRLLKVQAASLGKGIREYCLDLLAEGSVRYQERLGRVEVPEVKAGVVIQPVSSFVKEKRLAVEGSDLGGGKVSKEKELQGSKHPSSCRCMSCVFEIKYGKGKRGGEKP